jgi:hypothetical protein
MRSVLLASFVVLGSLPAVAQDNARLAISGDMVLGVTPRIKGPPPCVLSSEYRKGEMVVFRARVTDAHTGQALDASGVASVTLEVSNGQKFPMKFGPHPPKNSTDNFWTAAWMIPEDHPTGSFTYKVIATNKNGASFTWEPFKIVASNLTIIEK